jgi:hypothetical protein
MPELHRNDKIKIVIALLAIAGLIFFTLDTIFLLILGFIGWAYMKANSKQDKNSLIRFKMTPHSERHVAGGIFKSGDVGIRTGPASIKHATQSAMKDFNKNMAKINKDLKKSLNQD